MLSRESHPITLDYHNRMWDSVEDEEVAPDLNASSETQSSQKEEEFDNLVARYFTDVRRFTLLSRHEEKDLWHRIEQAHTHIRRVLSTSPTTLPTLTRLWHQVGLSEIPLEQVLTDAGSTPDEQCVRREQFGASVVQLQELDAKLRVPAFRPSSS